MKRIVALILTVGLLLTGCAGNSRDLMKDVKPSDQGGLITVQDQFSDGVALQNDETWDNALVADFGMRLFQASYKADQNTLISPMSILAALAMTANGAKGDTLTQMEAVWGQSSGALNSWYKYGTVYEDSVLNSANGIWFRENTGFTPEEDFLQTNADYYGAGIYQAPFNGKTVNDINSFVEEKTNGMIKEVLQDASNEAVMYLVNALAFEAKWEEEYKKHQLREGVFTKEDGTRQIVELMWSEENSYYENELCTGFKKCYEPGVPNRFAFVALLPKEGVSLQELIDGLEGKQLQEFLAQPETVKVDAAIPGFETEFEAQMSGILERMGMTDAFNGELADFSGMGNCTDGNLYISNVLHKTYVSVAEDGTRAGATTVVEIAPTAAPPGEMEEIKSVVLDRPFLYMILAFKNKSLIVVAVASAATVFLVEQLVRFL